MHDAGRSIQAADDERERRLSESAEVMRRAIRAVARSQRIIGQVRFSADARDADAETRRADHAARRPSGARAEGGETVPIQDIHQALASAISTFVEQLREAGEPPERMIVHLKRAFRETHLMQSEHDSCDGLFEDVVRIGIESYFR